MKEEVDIETVIEVVKLEDKRMAFVGGKKSEQV